MLQTTNVRCKAHILYRFLIDLFTDLPFKIYKSYSNFYLHWFFPRYFMADRTLSIQLQSHWFKYYVKRLNIVSNWPINKHSYFGKRRIIFEYCKHCILKKSWLHDSIRWSIFVFKITNMEIPPTKFISSF